MNTIYMHLSFCIAVIHYSSFNFLTMVSEITYNGYIGLVVVAPAICISIAIVTAVLLLICFISWKKQKVQEQPDNSDAGHSNNTKVGCFKLSTIRDEIKFIVNKHAPLLDNSEGEEERDAGNGGRAKNGDKSSKTKKGEGKAKQRKARMNGRELPDVFILGIFASVIVILILCAAIFWEVFLFDVHDECQTEAVTFLQHMLETILVWSQLLTQQESIAVIMIIMMKITLCALN